MSILSASIAEVKIGIISIEGLMDEKGEYYIAAPQAARLLSLLPDNAVRDIKAILGKEFSGFIKLKTPLNSNAVNALSLADFKKLLFRLALKGNQQAIELSEILIDLSLHQLFCDAFKVKFDADERQAHLIARMNGKAKRRVYTDAIADYIKRHDVSDNYVQWIYSNVSDALNIAVFTKKAKPLCVERGCKREHLRDTHDAPDLNKLEHAENFAAKLIDKQDKEPLAAMKEAITFYFE